MEYYNFSKMVFKIQLMKNISLNSFFLEKIIILLIPFFAIFSIFLLDFSLLILTVSFVVRTLRNKTYHYYFNKFIYIFLIFYFYILFRYLLREHDYSSFKSIFFYFRYGLYVLAIYYFLLKIEDLESLFLKSVIFSISLLVIDSFVQFIFGKNVLGNTIIDNNRVSSFFGDESILGSYLVKFLPFLYLILTKNLNNQKLFFFTLILIGLTDVVIFLSGERASFLLTIILTIYFIFMIPNLRILRILLLFVTASVILTIFLLKDNFSERYYKTLNEFVKSDNYTNNLILDKSLIKTDFYIISPTHHNYFLTSAKMFKDNKFFGQGPRSYRYLCNEDKFKINAYSCSNHPHNYYMQMLAELGIVGFSFLVLFYIYILIKIIKILIFEKKNTYMICVLCFFMINLWPLTSTGNFFNNWISILIYLPFSFFLLGIKKHNAI